MCVLLLQVPAGVLERDGDSLALSALFVVVLLVFGLVGAVVATRLPRNPIGWLFLVLALLNGVYELAYGYAYYTLEVDPGALPGAAWAAWVSNWTSPLSPPFLIAALLLFPDGRPPTPRWRWVAVVVRAARRAGARCSTRSRPGRSTSSRRWTIPAGIDARVADRRPGRAVLHRRLSSPPRPRSSSASAARTASSASR